MTRKKETVSQVLGYAIVDGVPVRHTIDTATPGDYGADPLGDGTYRMVPSGDIVDLTERNARLGARGRR